MKIFEIGTVWHSIHGCGHVEYLENGMLGISFASGLKRISVSVWGSHLFDREEEYRAMLSGEGFDREKMEQKYAPYKVHQDSREFIRDEQIELTPFFGKSQRYIVILMNRMVEHGRQIMGFDLESGKTVNIVDTNGQEYGCHSNQPEWESVKPNTAIKADFRYCPGKYINTIRITSKFKVLESVDLRELRKERQDHKAPEFIQNFAAVEEFCRKNTELQGFLMVNFTGTRVNFYKGSYQLKMGESFVNLKVPEYRYDKEKTWYYGMALIQFHPSKNRMGLYAVQLFDTFLSDSELENKKLEGMIMGETIRIRQEKAVRMAIAKAMGDPRLDFEESQEWYQHFYEDDYDNEQAYIYEELNQEYEGLDYDYYSETMEEYSDYDGELEEYYGE